MKTFFQVLVQVQEKQKEASMWLLEAIKETKKPEHLQSKEFVDSCIKLHLDLKDQIKVLKWVLESNKKDFDSKPSPF